MVYANSQEEYDEILNGLEAEDTEAANAEAEAEAEYDYNRHEAFENYRHDLEELKYYNISIEDANAYCERQNKIKR